MRAETVDALLEELKASARALRDALEVGDRVLLARANLRLAAVAWAKAERTLLAEGREPIDVGTPPRKLAEIRALGAVLVIVGIVYERDRAARARKREAKLAALSAPPVAPAPPEPEFSPYRVTPIGLPPPPSVPRAALDRGAVFVWDGETWVFVPGLRLDWDANGTRVPLEGRRP